MTKYPYDQLDFHFTVADDLSDDDLIITGYAIRSEDKGAFLFDLKALVEKYGGAGYDELLDNDEGDLLTLPLRGPWANRCMECWMGRSED